MALDALSAMTVISAQFVSLTYFNFPSRTAKSDIKVKIVGNDVSDGNQFYNIVTYSEHARKHETHPPRVKKKKGRSSVSIQTIVVLFVLCKLCWRL